MGNNLNLHGTQFMNAHFPGNVGWLQLNPATYLFIYFEKPNPLLFSSESEK